MQQTHPRPAAPHVRRSLLPFLLAACCACFAITLGTGCSDSASSTTSGSTVIGPEGGTVAIANATVTIPAGALAEDITITLRENVAGPAAAGSPPSTTAVSGAFVFTPHGTLFAKPVRVTLRHERSAENPKVYRLDDEDDTSWENIGDTTPGNGLIAFETSGFSIFSVFEQSAPAQCDPNVLEGDYDGNGDELAGVTEVTGVIQITNQDISDLSALDCLQAASGLVLSGNRAVTNVDALANLRVLGSTLVINDNDALENLDGLSRLGAVGADLVVANNDALENIDGLSAVGTVAGTVEVGNNPLVTNLNGLSSLTRIEQHLRIEGNATLSNIQGLNTLTELVGDISIMFNPELCQDHAAALAERLGKEGFFSENTGSCDDPVGLCDDVVCGDGLQCDPATGGCIDGPCQGDACDEPLEVVSFTPEADATTGNAFLVVVTFNKPVDAASLTTDTFALIDDTTSTRGGRYTVDGAVATFRPREIPEGNKSWSVVLKTDIKALDGNTLATETSWSFQTGPELEVVESNPAAGHDDARIEDGITVVFSQPIDESSVTPDTFRVSATGYVYGRNGANQRLQGGLRVSGNSVTWWPSTVLAAYYTEHKVELRGIRSVSGSRLNGGGTQFTFKTSLLDSNWYYEIRTLSDRDNAYLGVQDGEVRLLEADAGERIQWYVIPFDDGARYALWNRDAVLALEDHGENSMPTLERWGGRPGQIWTINNRAHRPMGEHGETESGWSYRIGSSGSPDNVHLQLDTPDCDPRCPDGQRCAAQDVCVEVTCGRCDPGQTCYDGRCETTRLDPYMRNANDSSRSRFYFVRGERKR